MSDDRATMAPGTVVADRYEVRRLLGEGGMGQVYEAIHRLTRRPVALKILRPEYAQDGELVARFLREAQAAAAVGDSHIVDVFDMGRVSDQGAFYLALELLTGQSLTDLIAREAPLPVARALHIGQQIAAVIGKAHRCSARIIHRDLKPDNVFLVERDGASDFVKVLDFGIAKLLGDPSDDGRAPMSLTQTSQILGTPLYMPPEQLKASRSIDERADVYSIGVILYEMLSGRVPIVGASLAEQFYLLMSEPITPLKSLRSDVDDALSTLVERSLSRDPELRPRDGAELAEALAQLARGASRSSKPSNPAEPQPDAQALAKTLHAASSQTAVANHDKPVKPPSRRIVAVAIVASALVSVAAISRALVVAPPSATSPLAPVAQDAADARSLAMTAPDSAAPTMQRVSSPDAAFVSSPAADAQATAAQRSPTRVRRSADAGVAPGPLPSNSDTMKIRQRTSLLAIAAVIAACASPVAPPNDSGSTGGDGAALDGAPDASRCIGSPQVADGPCRCQSDCALDAVCATEAETRAPRGRCITGCSTTAPTPEGFVCISTAGSARLFARCDASTPCREGWACTQEGAPAHCTPLCTEDSQCDSGVCDHDTGQCVSQRTPPVGAEVGEACARNDDCRGKTCLPGSAGFTGGYCSARCRVDAGPCLGDGFCYLPAADRAMGLQIGLCFKTCVDTSSCRAGYTCTPAGGARVCFR